MPTIERNARVALAALAGLCLVAGEADAAAPRAYVSVNGNDANPCNEVATPCRTFAAAVALVALGGEVVVLEDGTYDGGTINKSVTLHAPKGVVALVVTPMTVTGAGVTLRGLTFLGSGAGTALTGGGLNVENTVFHGWAVGLECPVLSKLNVVDTTFRDNLTGVSITGGGGNAAFERTQFPGNTTGLDINSDGVRVTLKNSEVSGSSVGIYVNSNDRNMAQLILESSVVTHNGTGVQADYHASGGFGRVRISNSTVTHNTTGLLDTGGMLLSRGNNSIEGNGTDVSGWLGTYPGK
jgi:hypothetical protein